MDGSSDNEAPKDPGVCQQRYTEQDYEGICILHAHFPRIELKPFTPFHLSTSGHRAHTVYVGVHMPSNRRSHRRHKHHHKDDDKSSEYDRPSKWFRSNSKNLKSDSFVCIVGKINKKKTKINQRKIWGNTATNTSTWIEKNLNKNAWIQLGVVDFSSDSVYFETSLTKWRSLKCFRFLFLG